MHWLDCLFTVNVHWSRVKGRTRCLALSHVILMASQKNGKGAGPSKIGPNPTREACLSRLLHHHLCRDRLIINGGKYWKNNSRGSAWGQRTENPKEIAKELHFSWFLKGLGCAGRAITGWKKSQNLSVSMDVCHGEIDACWDWSLAAVVNTLWHPQHRSDTVSFVLCKDNSWPYRP